MTQKLSNEVTQIRVREETGTHKENTVQGPECNRLDMVGVNRTDRRLQRVALFGLGSNIKSAVEIINTKTTSFLIQQYQIPTRTCSRECTSMSSDFVHPKI